MQRHIGLVRAACATMLLVLSLRPAAGEVPAPGLEMLRSGTLLMRMQQGYVMATLLDTDVNIAVNGLIARVSVMQQFTNTSAEWVEGVYVFPLPDSAAVDRMRLYIGDRFIEGEIREKEAARKTYEQAKQSGKRSSLVEQQRANLFTASVANIAPGETVIVEIEYLEDLRFDDGTFSLRFPMTLTPRYRPGESSPDRPHTSRPPGTAPVAEASLISPPMVAVSQAHKVSLNATVNAGMPLEIIASRYHPVHISESGGRYAVTLAGGQVPMDQDFELLWRAVPSSLPRAMVFAEMIEGDPYYFLMVVPTMTDAAETTGAPREMIFVVDTSGSMHGVSIEQAKQAMLRALDGLKPGDRFNVIEFNSYTKPLFAGSVAATSQNVNFAKSFVRRLNADGGTEMYPALEYALRRPSPAALLRQIIFITDGAVDDEERLFSLINDRLGNARLFTVGIGSAPNGWFMRKAAEVGRGSSTVISALHEVGEKMDRLFQKLEHPQITDIAVHWPGGISIDSYPETVPDLYRGEPVIVKAKASGLFRRGESVRISGDSIAGAWARDLALDISQQSPGVGALWARARIAALLDQARRGADTDETRNAIVETALAHHLVSKHTSLVAVDKTPVNNAAGALAKEQIPNLMPHGQSTNAIYGFPATATNTAELLWSGLAALVAGLLLLPTLRPTTRGPHSGTP